MFLSATLQPSLPELRQQPFVTLGRFTSPTFIPCKIGHQPYRIRVLSSIRLATHQPDLK